jgi:hypothetical protein
MSLKKDWLPYSRHDRLALAKNWQPILTSKATAWNIPTAEISALATLITAAEAALLATREAATRTVVTTAQCRMAFAALIAKMRFLKSRYFLTPPLIDADYAALQLKPKDTTRTPIPPPVAMAEADITRPAVHTLELHFRPRADAPPDPHHADYGVRIYYGVRPPGGANIEMALGPQRELVNPPINGDELPHSRFTRRRRERFDFNQTDSGKMAYFCLRYENAKGQPGPWGPLFSAVIP